MAGAGKNLGDTVAHQPGTDHGDTRLRHA
jgi:hypothetical protein